MSLANNAKYLSIPTRSNNQPASLKIPSWIIKLEGVTDKKGFFKGFEDFIPCKGFSFMAEREMIDESTATPGHAVMQNSVEYPLIFTITNRFLPLIEAHFHTGNQIKSIQIQEFSYQSGKAQSVFGANFLNCKIMSFELSSDGVQNSLEIVTTFTEHQTFTDSLKSNGDKEGKLVSYNSADRQATLKS